MSYIRIYYESIRGHTANRYFLIDLDCVWAMISRSFSKLLFTRNRFTSRTIHNLLNVAQANTKEAIGKRTNVQGWVRAMRKMKDAVFLDVTDGSTSEHLQVVMKKSSKPSSLGYGCCVSITGEVISAPNGKNEVHADDIRIIGSCDLDGYPFLPRKQYSQDYIRQYLHLRPRTRQFSSFLRLRDIASSAINDYMRSRGFINIHTPILTSNDCEGAGEVFMVKPESSLVIKEMKKENQSEDAAYFDIKTFLTVSGQLHLETMARALSRVYTFGPTFRAENSKSRLHLSEFYMIEAEMAFITDIKDLMNEAELFLKAITQMLIEKGSADMRNIDAHQPDWLNKDFGVMTYSEAIDILQQHSNRLTVPVKKNCTFSKEHELFLVEHNGGVPLFIINWPKEIKSFYMKECTDDSSKVAAMDLLVPQVGEVFGGSLREDDYNKLKGKLPCTANLSWYLELRKYGNVPTGGFGMGFERYLQTVLNIPNIKDVIPFPRFFMMEFARR